MSKYGKIRTRKNPIFGHFFAVSPQVLYLTTHSNKLQNSFKWGVKKLFVMINQRHISRNFPFLSHETGVYRWYISEFPRTIRRHTAKDTWKNNMFRVTAWQCHTLYLFHSVSQFWQNACAIVTLKILITVHKNLFKLTTKPVTIFSKVSKIWKWKSCPKFFSVFVSLPFSSWHFCN